MKKNTKQQNATLTGSMSEREQIYKKHGLKTEWVEKTGCAFIIFRGFINKDNKKQ